MLARRQVEKPFSWFRSCSLAKEPRKKSSGLKTRATFPKPSLEGGGSVHPNYTSLLLAGIRPAVVRAAFKVETIAFFEAVAFAAVEFDFETALQDKQEFLAFVSVGVAAASRGSDAKQMRLHHRVSPRKQFHSHTAACLEHLALGG